MKLDRLTLGHDRIARLRPYLPSIAVVALTIAVIGLFILLRHPNAMSTEVQTQKNTTSIEVNSERLTSLTQRVQQVTAERDQAVADLQADNESLHDRIVQLEAAIRASGDPVPAPPPEVTP